MGITENRELIAKANELLTTDLSSGGLLPAETAKQFFVRMMESSKLMQAATVVKMDSPTKYLPAIKLGSRALHAASEATALPNASITKPTLTQPDLVAKLFKAEIAMSDEVLEDNVQKGGLVQLCMEILPRRIAADIEQIALLGDTTSATADYAALDGLIKQATTNTYSAASTVINKDVLDALLATLPVEFRQDTSKLRYFTSYAAERKYRSGLADRATPESDNWLTRNVPVAYNGIVVEPLAMMPDTLGGSSLTDILLTDPKNIVFGFHREIKMQAYYEPRAAMNYILASVRWDVTYQDELGVAKATLVSVA